MCIRDSNRAIRTRVEQEIQDGPLDDLIVEGEIHQVQYSSEDEICHSGGGICPICDRRKYVYMTRSGMVSCYDCAHGSPSYRWCGLDRPIE